MKKKLLTGLLAAAMVFSIGTTTALAAGPQRPVCPGHMAADGTWARCTDADNNGICDICGAAVRIGAGTGTGAGFVDEDGDGVCDNDQSGICSGVCGGGYGRGAGRQRGCRGGRGR